MAEEAQQPRVDVVHAREPALSRTVDYRHVILWREEPHGHLRAGVSVHRLALRV